MNPSQRRRFLRQGLQGMAAAWGARLATAAEAPARPGALRQHADGRPFRVLMITYRGTTDVDLGFRAYLAEAGLDVRYTLRDIAQDVGRLPAILEELPELQPDLIYTWGTPVTLGVVGPYDQPPVAPARERGCPLCGAPMAEHTKGMSDGRTLLRCP